MIIKSLLKHLRTCRDPLSILKIRRIHSPALRLYSPARAGCAALGRTLSDYCVRPTNIRLTVEDGLHLKESKPLSRAVNDFTHLTTGQSSPSTPAETASSEGRTNLQTAAVKMGQFLKLPLRPLTQFYI